MSEWLNTQLEKLNEYQKEAVLTEEKRAVVNAHVGSGKTTVLIARMIYLHERKGIPYHDMLVLTFTNKAAGEIKARLRSAEGAIEEEELEYLGTFHGVAMRLLKTLLGDQMEASMPGWNKEFSVITPEEELELAEDLIAEHGFKIKYKNRLKKRMESYRQTGTSSSMQRKDEDDLPRLICLLEKAKRERNVLSFDDLIETTCQLLEGNQGSAQWNPKVVLIDEAQDCDEKQLYFLKLVIGEETGLFAVGDPNQTIYSWRGSKETTMFSLKNIYQAKEFSLPVNYRSSAEILEAAGRFMQSGTKLVADRSNLGQVLVRNHYDPFQEAEYLAEKLKELHGQGKSWSEMAVFYRLQEQSVILEKVLEREAVPYHIAVKKTLEEYPVLDFLVQLLRVSVNTKDENALKRMLTNKAYGPGLKGKKLLQFMEDRPRGGIALYDQTRSFSEQFRGSGYVSDKALYDYFQLDQYLHPTSITYEKDREMVLGFLKEVLSSFDMNSVELTKGIRQYLNQAALFQGVDREEEKDAVQLMTLHASKGLEFSCVFLIGVNQGLIPLWGKSESEEEEERRLFFVGMTRAKDRLELSYYTNPARQRVIGGPGRYLQMIPEELLDWKEKKSLQEKRTHLQELRKAVMENQIKEEVKPEERKIRHPRYGTGLIVSEDEMTVTAEFDGYGKKSFMKMMVEFL